jgi:small subunit ribosomal protein S6
VPRYSPPPPMAVLDYELILMLDPQADDDAREKVAADAKSKLEAKGEIKHEANWGMRKMAYEIDKRPEADYRYYRFAGEKPLLDELNHTLKITDGVLRFRVFKVDADSPTIVPPDTEQIMRRDEDDRDRGRGRGRDDRGPRGPRRDAPEAPAEAAPAPAEAAAEPAAEAPAAPADPA